MIRLLRGVKLRERIMVVQFSPKMKSLKFEGF